MRDCGYEVRVLVPHGGTEKFLASQKRLASKQISCSEVTRETFELEATSRSGFGLLSLGFPWRIPQSLYGNFEVALNVHPTLLPHYRGPTTGAYVLINGEEFSGSTVHQISADFDAGPIIAQSRVPLSPFETVQSLQRKVYASEPDLVMEALMKIQNGEAPTPQNTSEGSEFPKSRNPADSEIDPNKSLIELFNRIRASDELYFPAFFFHHGEKVCVKLWRPDKPGGEDDLL